MESDRLKFERVLLANHIEPGQGHRYTTHGAYQRMLKRHRMTDDVPLKEVMRCVTDTAKRARVREGAIQQFTKRLRPEALAATFQGRPVVTARQRHLMQRLQRVLTR